jgi:hypothetical protein
MPRHSMFRELQNLHAEAWISIRMYEHRLSLKDKRFAQKTMCLISTNNWEVIEIRAYQTEEKTSSRQLDLEVEAMGSDMVPPERSSRVAA